MTTYILVHGAFVGGSWSWSKVQSLLEAQGHTAIAPDLPGSGSDHTPLKEVTLQKYVDRIASLINEQSEPVIVVGHSLGGITLSQTNEVVPDKISKLVYVSAYLLQNGESNLAKTQEPEHASSKIGAWVELTEDAISIKPEGLKEVFCADCSDEDIERLKVKGSPKRLVLPGLRSVSILIRMSTAKSGFTSKLCKTSVFQTRFRRRCTLPCPVSE